jgi:hypothetical protein
MPYSQHISAIRRYTIIILIIVVSSSIKLAYAKPSYNVKQFGARGDGKSDDTKFIQDAIDKAATHKGSVVVFPQGTYLVSHITIKTNLKGVGNATIKKIKMPLDLFVFCNIRGVKSIGISGLTFDGSVILGSNNKPVNGSTPLHVYDCHDILINSCIFRNSPFGGLRLEACSNIKVTNCKSYGSRGVYGDGFYITGTNNVNVVNCLADDYERIGFVTEANSYNITFTDCLAQNGRNASILTGGIEYNAGFWYENSANIKTIRCVARNNTHRGFVATTGLQIGKFVPEELAIFEFNNCKSLNNPNGFVVSSFGKAVKTTLTNCQAINSTTGYHATARDLKDQFNFIHCKVSLKSLQKDSKNNVGFNWESPVAKNDSTYSRLPEFNFQNCHVEYMKPIFMERLVDKSNNNGDVSTYAGGRANINISNFSNSLKKHGTVIKARTGRPTYSIQKTAVDPGILK